MACFNSTCIHGTHYTGGIIHDINLFFHSVTVYDGTETTECCKNIKRFKEINTNTINCFVSLFIIPVVLLSFM